MVANRQPAPKQGSVQDLINGLLDRGYNGTVQPVLNAVTRSTNSGLIQQRLSELDKEVARLTEAGEKLKPDNPVLRALLADLSDTMEVNGRLVDGGAEAVQQTGINAANVIQRQLALPGMTDQQLAKIGIAWNRPDPEAVNQLVQYASSDAWTQMLLKYGDNVPATVLNQAIRGIAEGWSPLRTASSIRNITEKMPGYTANTLMRTLQLTSYRDATAASQNANSDIVQRVILIEALDNRTCLSCIDRHGQVIWDSETDAGTEIPRVDDHENGRGTSVVEVTGRTLNIQTGRDWFASLSPERQQQQSSFADSPGKWEAYNSGKVQLSDFVQHYEDDVFGSMVREGSLTFALEGE